MRILYNLGIFTYSLLIHLVAPFNTKAKLWVDGRRNIFKKMADAVNDNHPIAWFHAASLGEFEQGRPVIEAFREENPEYKILLTFFSPSGYEIRKNYAGADYIFYLPIDTPRNARQFIRIFDPQIAIFIKYEFWINYLSALKKHGTRTFVISAIFRPSQPFFRWYGGTMRRALGAFEHIFVQNQRSLKLLNDIGVDRVSVTGDTRFDRVYAIAKAAKPISVIEEFCSDSHVFIGGSTWPPDDQIILTLIENSPEIKFIIVPHEINNTHIEKMITNVIGKCVRYTQINDQTALHEAQVLIIDTIGVLSSAYRYGHWAYIGGGFGTGIHNTLEAATFGLPLAFGPRYEKFQEACDLIQLGGALSISTAQELADWIADSASYEKRSKVCSDYVATHKGATEQIINCISNPI